MLPNTAGDPRAMSPSFDKGEAPMATAPRGPPPLRTGPTGLLVENDASRTTCTSSPKCPPSIFGVLRVSLGSRHTPTEGKRISMLPARNNAKAWSISALLIFCLCLSPSMADATSFSSRQVMPLQANAFGSRSRRQRIPSYPESIPSLADHKEFHLCTTVKQSTIRSTNVKRTSTAKSPPISTPHGHPNTNTMLYFMKVALAGGIAGAVGSFLLYPMDAAKTLRQSSPSTYSSVFQALGNLACTTTRAANGAVASRMWHLQNVYRGVIPGTLGAIPSSALYFGAYESMKTVMTRYFPMEQQGGDSNFKNRLLVHALAAMSGNILSSAVFVPKELIKQQLQYHQSGNVLSVVFHILNQKGLGGLYVGYKATLLRNIPTAVMRFSLYEEFRYRWYTKNQLQRKNSSFQNEIQKSPPSTRLISPQFFLAGAAAGALASGLMTPVDVLKTRLATGTCPVDVKSCFLFVVKEQGFVGLYSGAGSRMFFSGAFSAIGFGTFEFAKGVLGVASPPQTPKTRNKEKGKKRKSTTSQ